MRRQRSLRPRGKAAGALLFGLVVAIGLCVLMTHEPSRTPVTTPPPIPGQPAPAPRDTYVAVGQTGKIVQPNRRLLPNVVYLAIDPKAWDEMVTAEADVQAGGPGCGAAIGKLIDAQRVAPILVGTRAKVVKQEWGWRRVQILDGDEAGTFGWIHANCIVPL